MSRSSSQVWCSGRVLIAKRMAVLPSSGWLPRSLRGAGPPEGPPTVGPNPRGRAVRARDRRCSSSSHPRNPQCGSARQDLGRRYMGGLTFDRPALWLRACHRLGVMLAACALGLPVLILVLPAVAASAKELAGTGP